MNLNFLIESSYFLLLVIFIIYVKNLIVEKKIFYKFADKGKLKKVTILVVFSSFCLEGLMPLDGHLPHSEDKYLHYLLTFGPMTRYAEDLSLLLRVMTLKCNRDLRLNVPVDLKQIKVYYRQGLDNSFGVLSMPEDIKDCILRAAHHFSHQYGIRAEKVQCSRRYLYRYLYRYARKII